LPPCISAVPSVAFERRPPWSRGWRAGGRLESAAYAGRQRVVQRLQPRFTNRHGDAERAQRRLGQERLGRRLLDDHERRPVVRDLCVDLYQTINFGAPPYPEYAFVGLGHLFTNANAYADLGRLYATVGSVNNATTEAAFQIAVWEIAYEATGTAYNLASGAATFTGGTALSSGALASTWLLNLASSGPAIGVLESRLHQDVIYAPVPEPSMVLLMAGGLLGVTVAARKRARATS